MKRQKRKQAIVFGMVAVIALTLITGCKKEEVVVRANAKPVAEKAEEPETEEKQKDNETDTAGKKESDTETESTTEVKTETYVFQDVEENSYEAELLEAVPKCTYDFSKLTEVNGFKHYEDQENEIISIVGIDVSEFQGSVDWQAVKDSGIEFVIVRMGYRGYGESGTLVVDPMFDSHVQGALNAGLQVGCYFFSQAISEEEAREEAAFVLKHIQPYNITGPVIFDTEEIKFDTARTDNNTIEQFTDYCIIFCDAVREAGYETMIYANMKWMAFTLDLTRLTEYPFWYADYHDVPQCPYAYEIWQYTETGTVPGIEGNVDINLWFQKTKY